MLGDGAEIDAVLVHNFGDDLIRAPVHRQQPESGEIARIWRHDAGLHVEQVHYRGRLGRPRSAERQQCEATRVDAALDGHLADGVGLVPVGNFDDAVGKLLGAHIAGQPRSQRGDADAGPARR